MKRIAILIAVALPLTGCATLDEEARESREYRRGDLQARYLEYRRQCYAEGGRIYVNATGSLDRNGVPKRGSRYTCGRR